MVEHLFTVQLIVSRQEMEFVQCAAVDLEKAFNSTQREQIIRVLNEIGTNEKLITDIANIFMQDFRNIQQKHAQESNKGAIQHHH